jgi:hypothetical protein
MRVRASEDHCLEHAGQLEIVGIKAASRDMAGPFFAARARADKLVLSHILVVLSFGV